MERVFNNAVYEQQRINIEKLFEENPNNWFYKMQMEKEPQNRTGFAPKSGKCYFCKRDITQGEKGITLEQLGDYIITGCPYCHRSFCD